MKQYDYILRNDGRIVVTEDRRMGYIIIAGLLGAIFGVYFAVKAFTLEGGLLGALLIVIPIIITAMLFKGVGEGAHQEHLEREEARKNALPYKDINNGDGSIDTRMFKYDSNGRRLDNSYGSRL